VTISGSSPAAEQGALVLFGGGDEGYFSAAAPIFRAIARKYFYVGAEMPATRAAFEVNATQSAQRREQDFSAVILEMEKRAHLEPGHRA
jgi:3-hydroxyisobutyrate dehydrogenase-like beta-hydroxyacid dehydrogenase